jgi:hypothetical protein
VSSNEKYNAAFGGKQDAMEEDGLKIECIAILTSKQVF